MDLLIDEQPFRNSYLETEKILYYSIYYYLQPWLELFSDSHIKMKEEEVQKDFSEYLMNEWKEKGTFFLE